MLKEQVRTAHTVYFCLMSLQKNRLTLLLMAISILLLLVLQYFWLKSSYQNEREQLRKETSSLFRSTVSVIQDSLIQQRIKFIPDSLHTGRMEFWRGDNNGSDSMQLKIQGGREARVQMIISGDAPDSLQRMLRPLTERMQAGQRNFVVRLDRDTLNIDSVLLILKRTFNNNAIDLPFAIHKLNRGKELTSTDSIVTEPVRFRPFER